MALVCDICLHKHNLKNIEINLIFSLLAFDAFHIKTKGEVKVFLMDNMGVGIPKERVVQHIKAFWQNGSFYLDLSYAGDPNAQSIDVVTPKMLEDYMKEIGQERLLSECKGKSEKDVASRQKIIQIAVDFIMSIFDGEADMFQRQMVANALVKLFPFVGVQNENDVGTVGFCFALKRKKIIN